MINIYKIQNISKRCFEIIFSVFLDLILFLIDYLIFVTFIDLYKFSLDTIPIVEQQDIKNLWSRNKYKCFTKNY